MWEIGCGDMEYRDGSLDLRWGVGCETVAMGVVWMGWDGIGWAMMVSMMMMVSVHVPVSVHVHVQARRGSCRDVMYRRSSSTHTPNGTKDVSLTQQEKEFHIFYLSHRVSFDSPSNVLQ